MCSSCGFMRGGSESTDLRIGQRRPAYLATSRGYPLRGPVRSLPHFHISAYGTPSLTLRKRLGNAVRPGILGSDLLARYAPAKQQSIVGVLAYRPAAACATRS